MESDKPIIGVITSRNCPTCGHHEIGIETIDGKFQALRPGDMVGLLKNRFSNEMVPDVDGKLDNSMETESVDLSQYYAWAPSPLLGHKKLRCKYGVLIKKELSQNEITGGLYEVAYKQKLSSLVEKEIYTPLPVLLDRYFVAPHIASGDSKQITEALWNEIEEIRSPVLMVQEWLERGNEDAIAKMIHPMSSADLSDDKIDDEGLKNELEAITLEDFFEML